MLTLWAGVGIGWGAHISGLHWHTCGHHSRRASLGLVTGLRILLCVRGLVALKQATISTTRRSSRKGKNSGEQKNLFSLHDKTPRSTSWWFENPSILGISVPKLLRKPVETKIRFHAIQILKDLEGSGTIMRVMAIMHKGLFRKQPLGGVKCDKTTLLDSSQTIRKVWPLVSWFLPIPFPKYREYYLPLVYRPPGDLVLFEPGEWRKLNPHEIEWFPFPHQSILP